MPLGVVALVVVWSSFGRRFVDAWPPLRRRLSGRLGVVAGSSPGRRRVVPLVYR